MAWARQAAAIRPGPGLKANISEPSCHGQPGAQRSRQSGEREGSRPAPADSGSECDHCESCVQSPAPESHTGPSQSGATASPGAGAVASQQEPPHPHSNIQTSERRGTMGTLSRK